MRIDQVVINASPLITLFRAGLQPLLPRLFSDVRVPEAVWDEVVNGGRDDPATRGLPGVDWIEQIKAAADMKVVGWNLGARRNRRTLICPAQPAIFSHCG
jgi:hypothetical protein